MKLYRYLSSLKLLRKSYARKFLAVAFIGIHVPLIGVIMFVIFSDTDLISPVQLIITSLLLTLGATALTLFVLNKLLEPVSLAKRSLDEYISLKKIPGPAEEYTDEMGVLLRSIRHNILLLEKAHQTKNDLIHTITHDLRAPLTQIVAITNLLEVSNEEEQKNLIRLARKSAEQELDFIQNYMALIETDDFAAKQLTSSHASLPDITQKAIDKLMFQLSEKNLTINIDITPSLNILTPNPLLFERVIQNLLTNAIKFSYPEGNINIHARADAEKVYITVTDEGIGFDPEVASQLFLKFTPLKRTGTQNEGTNGIGLYLTSEIVQMHGGKIWATSDGPDKGAKFHVEIPC